MDGCLAAGEGAFWEIGPGAQDVAASLVTQFRHADPRIKSVGQHDGFTRAGAELHSPRIFSPSMPEVAHPREHHRHARRIRRGDDLMVAD